MSVNFDGTPASSTPANVEFFDFYQNTSRAGETGYYASFFGSESSVHLYDNNSDGFPEISYENDGDTFQITWSGSNFTVNNEATGSLAYDAQGNAVGLYVLTVNPVFTLTPDTTAGDALVATFTIPSKPGTWSLLDSDLNGVVDKMTRVQTYTDENNVPQTTTNEYSLIWSDSTHWTARVTTVDLGFGSIFDNQGRPTTIPFYTHTATGPDVLHEIPLVWQTKGADNVVATASLSNVLSGKLLDTNGDNLPDQAIFTALSFGNSIEGGPLYTTVANFTGWSSLSSTNTHNPAEVQTSTDPSLMFPGIITGTSSNPTTIIMPMYFMGSSSNGTVPNIIINTAGSVSGTPRANENYFKFYSGTGVIATTGNNGLRLDLTTDTDNNPLTFNASWSWLDALGQINETSTGVLTFEDTDTSKAGPEEWSATFNKVETGELLADGTDANTLPDGFVVGDDMGNDVNVPLIWQSKDANNVIAIFTAIVKNSNNHDITFNGALKDTNGDNQPDVIAGTWGTETFSLPFSFTDTNSDGTSDHWSMIMPETRSGRVQVDASGNPAGLYVSWDDAGDTMTATSLTFDLGTTGATLASSGSIIVKLVNADRSRDTANIAVSSLTFDGTNLTIPLSGTDPVTHLPYAFDPSSGRELLVQIPAGVVVGQSVTSFNAWHVDAMNNNSYAFSPMTIVHNGAGTSTADWVIGTSGNDSIATGAGDDVLQWSDGNDTIDAGDGYDKLYMAFSSANVSKKIDSQGVLHIGEASLVTGDIVADAYRITRLSVDSYQLQQMDTTGTNVVRTMLLNNAEAIGVGNFEVHYFSIPLKVVDNDESVYGTPWRDTISLNAANISTLNQVWGDSSKDTLSVDMGAGYSKIEVVSDGSANVLKGTLISDGTVVDLGSFSKALPSPYNYTATMSIGAGENAHSFIVNNIEAYHFTSASVVLDVDPIPPTVTVFSPSDTATGVAVDSNIVLTFGENIQFGSGTIQIRSDSPTGTVGASYDVLTSSNLTINGNTLTINPTTDLAKGTHYFVTLDAGSSEDLAGNDYAGTTVYDFTTLVGGVITTDFDGDSFGCGVTIQADSKIVVVGSYMNEEKMDVALVRYNPDGTLDTSFGGGTGKLTTDFGYEDAGLCTIIQSDGKILVIGESAINGGSYGKCIIARYNIDGSFDTSFDGDGKVITNFLDGLNVDGFYTTDAILQSDGKILIVGGGYQSGNSLVTLFRYNSNGSLDSSFGNNGMVITPSISGLNSSDFPYGVVQQADEKILVAVRSADNVNITLILYNIDGTVDTSFNAASVEVTGLKENDIDGGLVLQVDGKILVSGSSHGNIVLLRYNSNGTLDNTFNGSGNVVTDLGGDDGVGAITLQTDGKILVSGYSNNDLALLRYNTDGTPDTHFGNTGIALTNIGSDSLHGITFAGWGITVQSDGKIIVSGESNGDFAVVRYNTDGTLDASFDGASDTTAPTLVSATPADSAMNVSVGSDLTLTFSEAIQHGSGTIEIHAGSPDGTLIESYNVATSSNLIISGNTLTINPTADLANNIHFFVTFSEGSIEDVSGNEYAGNSSYDFTTGVDASNHHALGGNITFWKGREAISDVTTTLSAMPIAGTQLVEFRDIHTNADGSHTVEIWATSSSDIASLQLEFMLSTGAVASWSSGDGLPADWMSAVNTATGQFQLASITGATALPAGTLKLGTLTVNSPTSAEHVELLLNSGTLGNEAVATTGIVFDSTNTGSNGSYHYLDVHDGFYSLMAERVAGVTEHSAVTAADALAALKMAVGLNPNADGSAVSPYQFLAADINHDGKIRATDTLNILKMAVGLETAPHDEWIFVPESVGSETMTRNHVDWSEAAIAVTLDHDTVLDLIGVVKGDVDGSWGGRLGNIFCCRGMPCPYV